MMTEARDLDDFLGSGDARARNGCDEEERSEDRGKSAVADNANEEEEHAGNNASECPRTLTDRLRELEDEQERLNNCMLALSTHFAQVQFRLKQVANAEPGEHKNLLRELQEFAFRGCPDLTEMRAHRLWHSNAPGESNAEHDAIMREQAARRSHLIAQLKQQLSDLEQFAYDTGNGELPSSLVLEKQKAVLDQLDSRMQLNLQLDTMTPHDLQSQVDSALKQLVNPIKVKEQLVEQLQTQITDLERFIQFLQTESPEQQSTKSNESRLQRPVHVPEGTGKSNPVLSLLGCQSRRFQRNELKDTPRGSHYGDALARLELAISAIDALQSHRQLLTLDDTVSSSFSASTIFTDEHVDVGNYLYEDTEALDRCEEECVRAVRKQLCPALRSCLEHGMLPVVVIPPAVSSAFGCFPNRARPRSPPKSPSSSSSRHELKHIWDVIVYYYELKRDSEFNETTTRKLSQSFKLDSIAGRSLTSKQVLLSTIETILASHGRLKRSSDSMFKALVCVALNEHRLGAWLRIILRCHEVVEQCFASGAFVRTGCDDLCVLLERLQKYHFLLPADLAIRPFHQMKDAF